MKYFWILLLALLCVSCKDDKNEPKPHQALRRVVVVYMAAENSLSSFAQSDLNEMRQAYRDIPDSCQLVVYLDDASTTQTPKILTFDNQNGEQTLYQFRNDPISTDSAAMQQVLDLVMQRCPARNYALVLWSHASGWIPEQPRQAPRRTFGVDNGENSLGNAGLEMEVSTLANILKNTGQRWDYAFFDACFMQGVEVAYELRDVVQWCIGSPAEIPGNGAPYHRIMGDLFAESDEAWRIAEDYYTYYVNGSGVVISAIRCDAMDELAAASASYLRGMDELPPTQDIQIYLSGTSWKPQYHDMGSAMHQWLGEAEWATWHEALDRAVPHRYASSYWLTSFPFFTPVITDADHIACMSMYIPTEGHPLNAYYMRTAWWKRVRGIED